MLGNTAEVCRRCEDVTTNPYVHSERYRQFVERESKAAQVEIYSR